MQNPREEIPKVIKSILSKDESLVRSATSKFFSEDFCIQHPIFNLSSKRNGSRFYIAWSRMNAQFSDISVHLVMCNDEMDRITVDLSYSYAPYIFLGEVHRMRLLIMFNLQKQVVDGQDVYLLSRQEDYYPTGLIPGAVVPFKMLREFCTIAVEFMLWFNGLLLAHVTVPVVLLLAHLIDRFTNSKQKF